MIKSDSMKISAMDCHLVGRINPFSRNLMYARIAHTIEQEIDSQNSLIDDRDRNISIMMVTIKRKINLSAGCEDVMKMHLVS